MGTNLKTTQLVALLLVLHLKFIAATTYRYVFIPKTNNSFFNAVGEGCMAEAIALNATFPDDIIECAYYAPDFDSEDERAEEFQRSTVDKLIENHKNGTEVIAGMAIAILNQEEGYKMVKEVSALGVPVVTFDSDLIEEYRDVRKAYVGSNNKDIGNLLAKVLEQIDPLPLGKPGLKGEYGILTSYAANNLVLRHTAIVERFVDQQDTNWRLYGGNDNTEKNTTEGIKEVTNTEKAINAMYELAKFDKAEVINNPSIVNEKCPEDGKYNGYDGVYAILSVGGWPMGNDTLWKEFVNLVASPCGITTVCEGSNDNQIAIINKGYADGLVGQLPYQMGQDSIRNLHDLVRGQGEDKDVFDLSHLLQVLRVPLELEEVDFDYNLFGKTVALGLTLFVIVLLASIYCAIWTIRNKESRVVKASQPMFLLLLCAGAIICALSILPFSVDSHVDENKKEAPFSNSFASHCCMMKFWLVPMGFTILFSALFSKTWRINKIFKSAKQCKRVKVTERDVLIPFVTLLGANIIVLLCFTFIAPLKYFTQKTSGTDDWNRPIASYGNCYSLETVDGVQKTTTGSHVFFILLGAIQVVALLMALHQAYEARAIKLEYSESRYIGVAFAFILQALLIGFPVMLLTYSQPQIYYIVACTLIFLITLVTLCLIFVPKMKAVRKQKRKEKLGLDRKSTYGSQVEGAKFQVMKNTRFSVSAETVPPQTVASTSGDNNSSTNFSGGSDGNARGSKFIVVKSSVVESSALSSGVEEEEKDDEEKGIVDDTDAKEEGADNKGVKED